MNDLELIDTADLVQEIAKRHRGSIILLQGPASPSEQETFSFFKGTAVECLGLLEFGKVMIKDGVKHDLRSRRSPGI